MLFVDPFHPVMGKGGLSAWVLPVMTQLAMQVQCGKAATDRLLDFSCGNQ